MQSLIPLVKRRELSMQIIGKDDIEGLGIESGQIRQWVQEAFINKSTSQLPHKISLSFDSGNKFFNTMPTIMQTCNKFGVKVVSRYPGRNPSLQADLLLYDLSDGHLLCLMDATWITSIRTGAVASIAMELFAKKDSSTVAVMGLGATGLAFLEMCLTDSANKTLCYKLLRYKDHAEKTKEWLISKGVRNIKICDSAEELIRESDVVVSAITVANDLIAKDEWFEEGVLLIPIHTRGFQNCDLFFDKVFADDREHVSNFKYFDRFLKFDELDRVLKGEATGRENQKERILAYNIGIAIHDIYIGGKIYDRLSLQSNRARIEGCLK